MRTRLMMLTLSAGLALPGLALAQASPAAAIQGVISDQIAAFRAQDFAKAFSYASPNLQGMFQTPENFGRMVSQGYSSVLNPAEMRFLGLRDDHGQEVQRLLVRAQDGSIVMWDYHMIKVGGDWKIAAVTPVQSEGVGT